MMENKAALFNQHNAPFAKMLGVEMVLVTPDRIEARLAVTPALATIPPQLHGGAMMAFADNLGGVGAYINMPDGATTVTVESKTNFLRPVPVGETAHGVATPIKLGRKIQVWETRITRDDGKLAAIVTQTQIIMET